MTASDFFNHVKVDSWSPESTPSDWAEKEFSTSQQIKSAGTYEVAFLYKNGGNALDISEVALLENGKEVAVDKHTGLSGFKLNDIAYNLKIKHYHQSATYTLRARIKGSAGTDSAGEVKIQFSE